MRKGCSRRRGARLQPLMPFLNSIGSGICSESRLNIMLSRAEEFIDVIAHAVHADG